MRTLGGNGWWRRTPSRSRGTTSPGPDIPRAYPYGVYDIDRNRGFVNVGTDHDTAAFAVASIRGWWRHEGRRLYPEAKDIVITADAGGSNGSRLKLWKLELQKLADETGISIAVTSLRERASGTRSSPMFSSSPRTGAANRCETSRGQAYLSDRHGQRPEGHRRLSRKYSRLAASDAVLRGLERPIHGDWNSCPATQSHED